MKRGNLFLSLVLVSVLVTSGCLTDYSVRDKPDPNTISFANTLAKPIMSCFNSNKVDIGEVNNCLENSHNSFEKIGVFNSRDKIKVLSSEFRSLENCLMKLDIVNKNEIMCIDNILDVNAYDEYHIDMEENIIDGDLWTPSGWVSEVSNCILQGDSSSDLCLSYDVNEQFSVLNVRDPVHMVTMSEYGGYNFPDNNVRGGEGIIEILEVDGKRVYIYMSANTNVAGFQFEIINSDLNNDIIFADGGSSDANGFMMSGSAETSLVLGFSISGTVIPSNDVVEINNPSQLMIEVVFNNYFDDGDELCFGDSSYNILSDSTANPVSTNWGDCFTVGTSGCIDEDGCNYDSDATSSTTCTYGSSTGNYDCNGNCIVEVDCAGVCDGDAVVDNCGECGGPGGYYDNCGVCDDNSNNDCVEDCAGEWGGETEIDCGGECGGDLEEDMCEVCGGDGSTCYTDCANDKFHVWVYPSNSGWDLENGVYPAFGCGIVSYGGTAAVRDYGFYPWDFNCVDNICDSGPNIGEDCNISYDCIFNIPIPDGEFPSEDSYDEAAEACCTSAYYGYQSTPFNYEMNYFSPNQANLNYAACGHQSTCGSCQEQSDCDGPFYHPGTGEYYDALPESPCTTGQDWPYGGGSLSVLLSGCNGWSPRCVVPGLPPYWWGIDPEVDMPNYPGLYDWSEVSLSENCNGEWQDSDISAGINVGKNLGWIGQPPWNVINLGPIDDESYNLGPYYNDKARAYCCNLAVAPTL